MPVCGPRSSADRLARGPHDVVAALDKAGRDPRAHSDAIIEGPGFRITVLTSRLIRLERSEDSRFVDRPTQLVRNRRFEVPEFTVAEGDGSLDLWTSHLHLHYDQQPLTPAGLSVSMRQRAQDSHRTTWHYGDPPYSEDGRGSNLGGTVRTLDDIDGAVPLEPGLLSSSGYAVVDDSASLLLTDDGWAQPRPGPGTDLYFFGYGRDHQAALRDFFALTGPNPLLPRWALGNWWSRYHRYTDDEYLNLVDRFTAAGIPFSVGVLDMDWHLVDIDPALGTGWTGYTWNPELFPDPAGFLRELHRRGLRVSLNVHPADGVRRHEAAYPAMARELGLDPERGLEIALDVTSREFVDAYFRHLHHPHERIGVDLWWLDWQSGAYTRVAGLDPLWMLNHLHYLDSGRDGRRPLTFSRYAGLGSHRYPIGFSGDTVATWDSLDFQPFFTATAANVGYQLVEPRHRWALRRGQGRRAGRALAPVRGVLADQPAAFGEEPVQLEGAVAVQHRSGADHDPLPAVAAPARAVPVHGDVGFAHRRGGSGAPDVPRPPRRPAGLSGAQPVPLRG